jgi:hypothetical protein
MQCDAVRNKATIEKRSVMFSCCCHTPPPAPFFSLSSFVWCVGWGGRLCVCVSLWWRAGLCVCVRGAQEVMTLFTCLGRALNELSCMARNKGSIIEMRTDSCLAIIPIASLRTRLVFDSDIYYRLRLLLLLLLTVTCQHIGTIALPYHTTASVCSLIVTVTCSAAASKISVGAIGAA